MADDTGELQGLKASINALNSNLLRIEAEIKDFRSLYLTVGSLKEAHERNEKDISASFRAVREVKSYMDENRGGQKVLFWVIGLSFGAVLLFCAFIFNQVSASNRGVDDLRNTVNNIKSAK